jgi:hypothetical protein
VQIQAAPDSNVRLVPPRAPRGPVSSRLRRLARSLLLSRIAGLLVLASASSMSACIIPVAPQFQDPQEDPQVPPSFVYGSANPPFGTLKPVPASGYTFTVAVTDPTPNAQLYFRAHLDYPPYSLSTRPVVLPRAVPNGQISITLDCNDVNPDPSVGLQHQLIVIVADQMFDPYKQGNLEALVKPGLYTEDFWQVDMSCPGASTP